MNYCTETEIQVALARYYDYLQCLVVPNVELPYEMDLVVLSKSGYASEIEIKISLPDLRKDAGKRHSHDFCCNRNLIKQLWFAIPESMDFAKALPFIPENAGIYVITDQGYVLTKRKPKINALAKQWDENGYMKLARLAMIKLWSLKIKCLSNGGKE